MDGAHGMSSRARVRAERAKQRGPEPCEPPRKVDSPHVAVFEVPLTSREV